MGSAPPLAEPAGFDMGSFDTPQPDAPPLDAPPLGGGVDMGFGGDMQPPPSDALPTFDDPAPPPEMAAMPAMDSGMGGGMGIGMDSTMFAAPDSLGPVAKWRLENAEKVAAKASAAQAAEAAKIAEASSALQQFYAERTEKTQKRAQANRDAEAQYVSDRDAAMIADSWDSVVKLVDLKEKANQEIDTSRMRSLLFQLKN